MLNNKRIIWIVDIKGWAFFNKAKHISSNIDAKHLILPVASASQKEIKTAIDDFEPDILIFLSYFHFNKVKNALCNPKSYASSITTRNAIDRYIDRYIYKERKETFDFLPKIVLVDSERLVRAYERN